MGLHDRSVSMTKIKSMGEVKHIIDLLWGISFALQNVYPFLATRQSFKLNFSCMI